MHPEWGERNKFYGSLKSWKNLTKLSYICIEATDVDEGLEYLPVSLFKRNNSTIECFPKITNAKCKTIQDQLHPFNYDLEAWQLAHPEKMLIARPEYFTNPDSKDKWLSVLKNKIKQSQETLNYIIQNEPNKEIKIVCLETQIKILEEMVESQTNQNNQCISNLQQQNEQYLSRIRELEQQLNERQQNRDNENNVEELTTQIVQIRLIN